MGKKKKKRKNGKQASFQAGARDGRQKVRKISGPPMVVDGEPVRRAARQAHEKVRAQMEVMEKQIQDFERQELPAYQRWMHLNFGVQLTQLRDTELAASAKEDILERVESYQIWGNLSPLQAYAKVKEEMENPDACQKGGSENQTDAGSFAGLTEEDEEDLREAYEAASYMFEQDTGFEAPDFESFKQAIGLENKQSKSGDKKPDSEKARIKKLYRKIARSLHPDCSDQFSMREQRLWHRAQDAYKAGDIVGLETVLSHIEAAASGPLFALTVSDLMESTSEMRTRVNYLEEDLYQARQHPSWKFTQKTPGQLLSLRKRVDKEITRALQQAQRDLESVQLELQKLEFAYTRFAAGRRKGRKRKQTAISIEQTSFNY